MKTKEQIFQETESFLQQQQFHIFHKDDERPWGGFFVIEEADAKRFAQHFFPDVAILEGQKISPKILLVEPGKKLSWQYHHRRAELWKLIDGEAAIVRSLTDKEGEPHPMELNEVVQLSQGERHRLVGLQHWGAIAEIWIHVTGDQPSNEEDIVRLQDDFGRK